jgi:hypothetical protein
MPDCSNCGRPVRVQRDGDLCWECARVWDRTIAQSDRFGIDAGKVADVRLRELAEARTWRA